MNCLDISNWVYRRRAIYIHICITEIYEKRKKYIWVKQGWLVIVIDSNVQGSSSFILKYMSYCRESMYSSPTLQDPEGFRAVLDTSEYPIPTLLYTLSPHTQWGGGRWVMGSVGG